MTKENYLEHHGIDHQQWGVRHGPPYPLKESVSKAIQSGKEFGSKNIPNSAKNGKNAAVAKTSQKVVNEVAKKTTGKTNKMDLDTNKLMKEALFTFGTVAVTSLLAAGVNAGIDKAAATAYKTGKITTRMVLNDIGSSLAKSSAARKGIILI